MEGERVTGRKARGLHPWFSNKLSGGSYQPRDMGEVPISLGIGGRVLPAHGWRGVLPARGQGSMDCSMPGSSVLHYLPLTFVSVESVMPSNHLILCRPLLLWLQSFPTSASSPLSDFRGFSLELKPVFFISTFLPIALPCHQSHGFPAEPFLKGRQAGDGLARRRPRDVGGPCVLGAARGRLC